MFTLERVPAINPEAGPTAGAGPADSAVARPIPPRRITRLDADYHPAPPRRAPAPVEDAPPPGRSWLRLAELVLGNWAPTLRWSLALAACFLCLGAVLVVAWGFGGVLLCCGFAITLHRLVDDEPTPHE